MNAATRTRRNTQGQQFAKTMRYFLSIGTRTRRDRKGLDLHREIAEWVVTAAMQHGTLPPDGEAAFAPAFGAVTAWIKDIKNGRASYLVIEHINQLSPYQFCNLLADMIDAGVTTSSAGAQYFNEMRTRLLAAATTEEDDTPGQPEAAEPTHTAAPRGGISRRLGKVTRRTRAAAQQVAKALSYRTLSGIIATLVDSGRLIRTGDFLDRIGGGDLPDGQQSWYGRHVAKAHRATHDGADPIRVWAQHRTTGKWVHVFAYTPTDHALTAGLHSYKATRHLADQAAFTEAA